MKFINFESGSQRYLLAELPKGYKPIHLAPHRSGWDGLACRTGHGDIDITLLPEGKYEFVGALNDVHEFYWEPYMTPEQYYDGNFALLKIL